MKVVSNVLLFRDQMCVLASCLNEAVTGLCIYFTCNCIFVFYVSSSLHLVLFIPSCSQSTRPITDRFIKDVHSIKCFQKHAFDVFYLMIHFFKCLVSNCSKPSFQHYFIVFFLSFVSIKINHTNKGAIKDSQSSAAVELLIW